MSNDSDRYKVVRTGFWWRIKIGDGSRTYGRFYTHDEAEKMAALLLREFRNGKFSGNADKRDARTERDATVSDLVKWLHERAERAESERDALRAENERLRKDAERYRWIRENFIGLNDDYLHICQEVTLCGIPLYRRMLKDGQWEFKDDAIDAAMNAATNNATPTP